VTLTSQLALTIHSVTSVLYLGDNIISFQSLIIIFKSVLIKYLLNHFLRKYIVLIVSLKLNIYKLFILTFSFSHVGSHLVWATLTFNMAWFFVSAGFELVTLTLWSTLTTQTDDFLTSQSALTIHSVKTVLHLRNNIISFQSSII
jgi:hypothetical protein